VIPLVMIAFLAVGQVVLAGYALWSAATAARAGARAEHVGGDPRVAARSTLPAPLRTNARIEVSGPVEVTVGTPKLVPGLPVLRVRARAGFDPAAGDG
jgi:hypothetical protein